MIANDQTLSEDIQDAELEELCERDDFVSNTLVDFEQMRRFDNRRNMMKPGCFVVARAAEFNKS